MEYLVHHARGVPFSSQVMVDEEELLGLIDELRHHLPEEIKQANWTVQEQQRLIAEAHAEASRITARANERAQTAVQEHEVLRQVERQSQQTLRDAQERADGLVCEHGHGAVGMEYDGRRMAGVREPEPVRRPDR